jgi:hypothetical protein
MRLRFYDCDQLLAQIAVVSSGVTRHSYNDPAPSAGRMAGAMIDSCRETPFP